MLAGQGYLGQCGATVCHYPTPDPNGTPLMTPRQFLGKELCRARVAAGFSSQQALADHLGFERTTVAKVESGDRVPSDPVLTAWCNACDIDTEHYQRLADLARTSDGPVPAWFEYWLERERTAHMLRYWSPIIVHPLFETADYRRAVVMAGGNDPERADELVSATVERQQVLLRADPPEIVTVLHEMVLHRLIGSPQIMYDALTHLADLAGRPNISVHVVPSSTGAHAGLSGDISLASGDGGPDVLHTDAVPEGHTTETRALVRRAAVTFERIRRDALPCAQSRDLILRTADEQWKN
jgi:transcriptional regulator with XRE-family HTH domain